MSRKTTKKQPALHWEEHMLDLTEREPSVSTNESISSTRTEPNSSNQLQELTRLVCALTSSIAATNSQKNSTFGSETIPSFDPRDKTTEISRWLAKVEELKQIYGWSEATTICFATSKLKGYAKTWYEKLPSVNYSWEEWKEKLTLAFPSETDYFDMLAVMMRRTKLNGESVVQYYYDKLALLNTCEIFGQKAVSCIIAGIPDNNVQMVAKAGNYQNTEGLLKYLKTIEVSAKETIHKPAKLISRKHKEFFQGNDVKRGRYEQQKFDGERRKCYGCGSRDHLLPNCQRKPKCVKCNRQHAGRCERSYEPSKQGQKEIMAIEKPKTTSKKFFIDIFINDIKVDAYIDLGSECNTIKDGFAKSINLPRCKETIQIRGFGGGVIKTIGTVRNVKVRVDEAEAHTNFVIVPNESQNVTCIIGHPFTELEGVTIYKDCENLRIFTNNFCELPELIDIPSRKVPVWAKYTTVLPPKHIANVVCRAEIKGCYYLNSSTRMKENNEYVVLRSIVNIDENNECIIPVVNPTDNEVIIKTNKVFARGEKCDLEDDREINPQEIPSNDFLQKIHIGKSLSMEEKEELHSLLQKYKHCFASSLEHLGCTTAAELKIELLDEKPVTYRPYRMNPSSKEKVKEIVEELLKYNIIRESASPFASPVLLVKKKNGEQRLCIDYRKLNEKIKQDKFPLPRIDEQIDQLHGHRYFTTLDMTSGYYQIPVEESSKSKTSFVTADGQYEFNRMPFGISTAPSVFQRMMNKILGPLRGTEAIVYLDDVLVPSVNFEQGVERLSNVLEVFSQHHLTLNPEKCHFFETSISYLGFEVDANGMKPGLKKTECIMNFPIPKNIHQVRQFLGLTGFFRQFIKDYALLVKPLTNLLRKEQPWVWTELEQKTFQELKKRLLERPVLAIYNPQADTEVHTDASKVGLAGILLQKDPEGKQHAVAYYSRQTTPAEEKYHSYELETLAVVETLRKFRVYLLDIKFKVITDCSAIKSAAKKKDLMPRIARWWLTLQEFTFDIEHRPGTKMSHVDALSRNPVDHKAVSSEQNEILRIEIADWVLASQLSDEKVENIHNILRGKPTSDYERNIHKEYKLENERVYKVTENGLKWLVPKGMRSEVIRAAHDEFGHFALEKTLKKVCENYWFPNMRNYIQRYINSCIRCLYHKQPAGKKPGLLNPIEKISTPFDTIHMDHLGPFVKSTSGKKFLIVCVEAFTKYTMLHAVKDTKTQPVLRFLEQIINQFGVPRRIITDKGSCYTSKAFGNFCKQKGITHIQNAVSTPRANGQVERFNSTVLASLAATAEEDTKWDKSLNKIQFAINNSVHSITKKTPSELLYGYKPTSPGDAPLVNEINLQQNNPGNIHEAREQTAKRIKESQRKQKEKFDGKRLSSRKYNVGELVLVRKRSASEGQSRKLLPKYKGPYRIIRKLPNDRFVVRELSGSTRSGRASYENVESIEHLKKWIPAGGKSDTEDEVLQEDE